MGGSEVEFYLFKDSYEAAANKQYSNLQPSGTYIEDYHIFQGTKAEAVIGAIDAISITQGCPWNFPRANGGLASRRSIYATRIFSKWPTATASTSTLPRK